MGHDPDREPPFFFMKPADADRAERRRLPVPVADARTCTTSSSSSSRSARAGPNIPAARALDHVFGYAVGLDMTRRDLQGEAKKMGRPWDTGKAFDGSAPCSADPPASEIGHPTKGAVWLEVNGPR